MTPPRAAEDALLLAVGPALKGRWRGAYRCVGAADTLLFPSSRGRLPSAKFTWTLPSTVATAGVLQSACRAITNARLGLPPPQAPLAMTSK